MNDENKVVSLTDYIERQEEIKTLSNKSKPLDLTVPNPHLVKRGISFMIDFMAVGIIKTAIHGAYAVFVNQFLAPVSYSRQLSLVEGNMLLHVSIFVALYFSYFLYCTVVMEGKTLGKMAMGLKVINEEFYLEATSNNYHISTSNALRRALGYVLCYLSFGTFFIFNFSSEDKRGLPDYLSSSRTVSDQWFEQTLDFKLHASEQVVIDIQSLETKEAA